MIIGIDVDEVLADTLEAFFAFHNDVYGTHADKSQMTSYFLMNLLGGTHAEILQKWEEFYKSEYNSRVQPVRGASDAIKELAKNHSLYIITSRPEHLKEMTQLWVKQHIDTTCPEVHFASADGAIKKSDICKKLGVELHIDDSYEFGLDCVAKGVNVLLMHGPWNAHETIVDGMKRVHSWDEILANVNSYDYQRTLREEL